MSNNDFELNASARIDLGKGASRRLRRLADLVPAIIYGGKKAPESISIPHKDILRSTTNEAFFSHIITLVVDGKKQQVVIKAMQRHPAKPRIMHADFQRVDKTHTINVKVPVHLINEDKCKGVKVGGGSILKTMSDLEVVCLPQDLPEYLEIDMADLNVGESIHISQIKMPKGVTSVDLAHGQDSDHAVVTVQAPRVGTAADGEGEGEGAEA